MGAIPDRIVSARLRDTGSEMEFELTTRDGSTCQFAERVPLGEQELGLRIDWKRVDANGDPLLKVDFFIPSDSKRLPVKHYSDVHHLSKQYDESVGQWLYSFEFDGLRLDLLLEMTCAATITGSFTLVEGTTSG